MKVRDMACIACCITWMCKRCLFCSYVHVVYTYTTDEKAHRSRVDTSVLERIHLSKSNRHEATLVVTHITSLLKSGVMSREIAVVTPYNAQVNLIKEMLLAEGITIEVGTGEERVVVLVIAPLNVMLL